MFNRHWWVMGTLYYRVDTFTPKILARILNNKFEFWYILQDVAHNKMDNKYTLLFTLQQLRHYYVLLISITWLLMITVDYNRPSAVKGHIGN